MNQNYIQHGINRFLTEEHEYAKGDESAAMIGFVESMEFDVILYEVNTNIASCELSIPPLSLSEKGWQSNSISYLEHTLIRTFPISPFQLLHFWLDIRNCDLRLPTPKLTRKPSKQTVKSLREEEAKQKGEKLPNLKTTRKKKHKVLSQGTSQLEFSVDQTL